MQWHAEGLARRRRDDPASIVDCLGAVNPHTSRDAHMRYLPKLIGSATVAYPVTHYVKVDNPNQHTVPDFVTLNPAVGRNGSIVVAV